jgi:uncharacterized protein YodC (DUF2158 family)
VDSLESNANIWCVAHYSVSLASLTLELGLGSEPSTWEESIMASDSGIQLGDRVQLKSGGPIMTVGEVSNDGSLWCQWFDTKDELKGSSFNRSVLAKVPDRGA